MQYSRTKILSLVDHGGAHTIHFLGKHFTKIHIPPRNGTRIEANYV